MDCTNGLLTFQKIFSLFSPYAVEVYRSPVETICTNIDYYIPDDKGATKSFSEDAMARLRKILSSFIHFVHEWCHWHRWSRRGNILVPSFPDYSTALLTNFHSFTFHRLKRCVPKNWQILPLYLTHFPVVHSSAVLHLIFWWQWNHLLLCVIITEVEKSKNDNLSIFSFFLCV